jgi:pimeloyl-ACP methyl ester carboxylesterase
MGFDALWFLVEMSSTATSLFMNDRPLIYDPLFLIPFHLLISFPTCPSSHSPSELFLKRITKVPVQKVMLDGAGHYPLEQPGIDQLHAAIAAFVKDTVLAGK